MRFNVRHHGALADGVTDDSEAFRSCRAAIERSIATSAAYSNPMVRATMEIPPGVYLLKSSGALMDDTRAPTIGFDIEGGGLGSTLILFQPDGGNGTLFQNLSSWLFGRVAGVTFYSNSATNHFWRSEVATGAPQGFDFQRVAWAGAWGKVFELQGSNNNSEFSWTDCRTEGTISKFLYVGETNTSDQFLNYWFDRCKFWHDGDTIDMSKGGSITVRDCDWSGWDTGTAFALRGTNHAHGVCRFLATGCRFELKSNACKVIYSEWPQGTITFDSCDASSQAGTYDPAAVSAEFRPGNTAGSIVAFRNCSLIGTHLYASGNSAVSARGLARYVDCEFVSHADAYEAIVFAALSGSNYGLYRVECQGVRGADANAYHAQNGTLRAGQILPYGGNVDGHEIALASPAGLLPARASPTVRGSTKVVLPPNAIVGAIQFRVPDASNTQWGPATYFIKAGETLPVTLATINVSVLAQGAQQTLAPWYVCGSSLDSRTITLEADTDVEQFAGGACLLTYF
jgi:hypothetical protein